MFQAVYPGYYEHSSDPNHMNYCRGSLSTPAEYTEHVVDNSIFGSDEFRMYAYKIKRCPRLRSHDWTECPYAHRGEKAQRRDPRKYSYSAIVCPEFRAGRCERGDRCEFAHGVFEYWLHPTKYRTRACNAGPYCQRKVCFFAHTAEQLRPEPKLVPAPPNYCTVSHYQYPQPQAAAAPYFHQNNDLGPVGSAIVRGGMVGGSGTRSWAATAAVTVEEYKRMMNNKRMMDESFEKVENFLNSLRALKLSDDLMEFEGEEAWKSGVETAVPDLKDVTDLLEMNWLTDLVD